MTPAWRATPRRRMSRCLEEGHHMAVYDPAHAGPAALALFVHQAHELRVARHEALLAIAIPERPGSFKRLCQLIGNRSITEFPYRYADASTADQMCFTTDRMFLTSLLR